MVLEGIERRERGPTNGAKPSCMCKRDRIFLWIDEHNRHTIRKTHKQGNSGIVREDNICLSVRFAIPGSARKYMFCGMNLPDIVNRTWLPINGLQYTGLVLAHPPEVIADGAANVE